MSFDHQRFRNWSTLICDGSSPAACAFLASPYRGSTFVSLMREVDALLAEANTVPFTLTFRGAVPSTAKKQQTASPTYRFERYVRRHA